MNHARLLTLAVLSLAGTSISHAGDATSASPSGKATLETAVAPKEESIYDKIWGLAKLYEDKDAPFLQELSFSGRYHGQYHWTDADTGNFEDWENRRFRLGLEGKFLDKFAFRAQFESDKPFEEVYSQFTELYLSWNASEAFNLTVGKQKPRFTYEWDTSSRNILTFERSMLVNQMKPNYTTGISANGKLGNWIYYTGVFDNSAEETLGIGGGVSEILSIGYDFKKSWGLDMAEWRVQYLHSSHDAEDRVLSYFDNSVATNLQLKQGKVGFYGELLLGTGDKSDAFGVMLMPTYDLTKKLQIVGRYQFATSPDENGLVGQRRYENESGGGPGDRYNAAYLGFNYRIYGDKLKLMGGVEYANMQGAKGFEGWTALTGIRIYW